MFYFASERSVIFSVSVIPHIFSSSRASSVSSTPTTTKTFYSPSVLGLSLPSPSSPAVPDTILDHHTHGDDAFETPGIASASRMVDVETLGMRPEMFAMATAIAATASLTKRPGHYISTPPALPLPQSSSTSSSTTNTPTNQPPPLPTKRQKKSRNKAKKNQRASLPQENAVSGNVGNLSSSSSFHTPSLPSPLGRSPATGFAAMADHFAFDPEVTETSTPGASTSRGVFGSQPQMPPPQSSARRIATLPPRYGHKDRTQTTSPADGAGTNPRKFTLSKPTWTIYYTQVTYIAKTGHPEDGPSV